MNNVSSCVADGKWDRYFFWNTAGPMRVSSPSTCRLSSKIRPPTVLTDLRENRLKGFCKPMTQSRENAEATTFADAFVSYGGPSEAGMAAEELALLGSFEIQTGFERLGEGRRFGIFSRLGHGLTETFQTIFSQVRENGRGAYLTRKSTR